VKIQRTLREEAGRGFVPRSHVLPKPESKPRRKFPNLEKPGEEGRREKKHMLGSVKREVERIHPVETIPDHRS